MVKDIFIDNDSATNFSIPLNRYYKKLLTWLISFDAVDKSSNAYLVVSNKILSEYNRTSGNSLKETTMPVIIETLTQQGRLIKFSNVEIKNFKIRHFKKHIRKNLTCNSSDRDHIPVVLLSHRKYALSLDDKLRYDLKNFPGFTVLAEDSPHKIPYEK